MKSGGREIEARGEYDLPRRAAFLFAVKPDFVERQRRGQRSHVSGEATQGSNRFGEAARVLEGPLNQGEERAASTRHAPS